jgi:hypothetical protein
MKDSINEIGLNDILLAGFYHKSLVHASAKTDEEYVAPALQYLGENDRKVLIMVEYPDAAFLPDEAMGFLNRMLGACKLTIKDVAIINNAKSDQQEAIRSLSPSKILSFGTGTDNPAFEINDIDGVLWLHSTTIEDLFSETEESRSHKTRLWAALKKMFSV